MKLELLQKEETWKVDHKLSFEHLGFEMNAKHASADFKKVKGIFHSGVLRTGKEILQWVYLGR